MSKYGPRPLHETFEITQELLDRIYQLTANGLTKVELAGCLCMEERTLNKLIKKHTSIRKAIADGRYFGLQNATSRLRALVDQGNPAAIMFYLKTRWMWRERDKPGAQDNLQTDKKPDRIDFNSMSPQDASKVYQQFIKGSK